MRRGEANPLVDPGFHTDSDPFDLDSVLRQSADARVRLSWLDRIEVTRVLTARGYSLRTIGLRIDVSSRTVARYRRILRDRERGC